MGLLIGLLLLFILWRGLGLTPTMIALILLGIPPLLAGSYSGVANVDRVAIAAYAGLGGLGRPVFDGLATYDYPPMIAGSLLVTVLALILDSLLAGMVWISVPGTGRLRPVPKLVKS